MSDNPADFLAAQIYLHARDHETGKWLSDDVLRRMPGHAKLQKKLRRFVAEGGLNGLDLPEDARQFISKWGGA